VTNFFLGDGYLSPTKIFIDGFFTDKVHNIIPIL